MRARGQVFAHVDWRRMDESQLDGMRYVAYTPTGVVDGRFAPMPTRNGLPMPYLVDEAIGFPVILLTVLFAINGWRAVGRARMRKTECREFIVDGCHNLIIAGDD